MHGALLWNPVTLVDGETRWFLLFLAILAAATLVTHFWRILCEKLHVRYVKKNQLLQEAVVASVQIPVIFFVWFVAFFVSVDLITDTFFSYSLPKATTILPYVIAVIVFTWFLLLLKKNVVMYVLEQSKQGVGTLSPARVFALGKLLTIVIVLFGLLLLMEVTGMSLNVFLAVSGISGLALAFASQEIVANFFGGMMVHIVQPFAVGEHISIAGTAIEGEVEDIGWYETRLRSNDFQLIYIPNSQFSKASVSNSGRRTERKILEKLAIRIDDTQKLSAIIDDLHKIIAGCEIVNTDKTFYAYIEQIGPNSIDLGMQAISSCMNEIEYAKARNKFLIDASSVIKAHGAKLLCNEATPCVQSRGS